MGCITDTQNLKQQQQSHAENDISLHTSQTCVENDESENIAYRIALEVHDVHDLANLHVRENAVCPDHVSAVEIYFRQKNDSNSYARWPSCFCSGEGLAVGKLLQAADATGLGLDPNNRPLPLNSCLPPDLIVCMPQHIFPLGPALQ